MSRSQAQSIARVIASLKGIGYGGERLQPDYAFEDWLSGSNPERTVSAAAFGSTPIGPDSACFSVVASDGSGGVEHIRDCRAVGAPRAFEVDQNGRVFHWRVGVAPKEADRQEVFEPTELESAFRVNESKWSPDEMLRAKHIGPVGFRQPDFIDLGLMPAIEESVREKIVPLLRETLHAAMGEFVERTNTKPNATSLFQLVFRALTGKILRDRRISGFAGRAVPDAKEFLDKVGLHYNETEPIGIRDRHVQQLVLERLWAGVNLKNISVETLAYVWENALLTKEDRKEKSIHATPPSIARYIVNRLPITSEIAATGTVVEPCCGAATLLVAAMRRFKDLLPATMSDLERHKRFKNALYGFDTESFGLEVAKCRLMLADFPHPNKWNTFAEDVFASEADSPKFFGVLRKATVVLCNPPFGTFSAEERERYDLNSVFKPIALLDRVLSEMPIGGMLGWVMPNGKSYKKVRAKVAERFGEIEVVTLPDHGVFEKAEQETVLGTVDIHASQSMVAASWTIAR